MARNKLKTKNLPDAIEWHFAKHWIHVFKKFKINKKELNKMLGNMPYGTSIKKFDIDINRILKLSNRIGNRILIFKSFNTLIITNSQKSKIG